MRRLAVVGTTGSGKTMLAREISKRLEIPHIELDSLFWGPHWTEPPVEAFRERVARVLTSEAWVVDGNYSKVRDIVWTRADTVVWLDYSLPVILARLARRAFQRVVSQEELWSGNRERLRTAVFSRNSLFVWALKTYRRRRREYPVLPNRPEFAHLAMIRLRTPRAAETWLSTLAFTESGRARTHGGDPRGR